MKAFTELDAIASPVMRQNIDTDIVIPIHRLRDVAQAELGPYAFEPLRYLPDGSDNPEFPLNKPAYKGAEILVADNNFACGSSREGRGVGADGHGHPRRHRPVLRADLPQQLLPERRAADPARPRATCWPSRASSRRDAAGANSEPRLGIDLHNRTVTTPSGRRIEFQVDGIRRDALLKGLNEVALTFDARGRDRRPPGQGARQDAVALSTRVVLSAARNLAERPAILLPRVRSFAALRMTRGE
jgi:3-isopropylmalate/(R)-2-methylmalate dehydratase small subunit